MLVNFFSNPIGFKGKTRKSRKMKVTNLETNEVFYFDSIKECHEKLKVSKACIAMKLNENGIMKSRNLQFTEIF